MTTSNGSYTYCNSLVIQQTQCLMVSSTELRKKQMPEASDKGSQPYSRADRYGEMAGSGLHGVGESLPLR